jgi:streptogrisin C
MSLLAHRGRLAAAAVTGAALAAATVVATPALAGSSPSAGPRIVAPANDDVALASLQGDFGLTRAEAQQRIAAQQHLSAVGRQLTTRLGSEAAGSYIDQRTGDLVVNVLDRSAAATVRAAGATPHVVTHSLASLDAIKAGLDAAARAHHAGRAMSWYVDVPTDSVHVTVPAGATDAATRAFVAQAKRAGDAVEVIPTTAHLSTTNLYGGDQVEMSNGYICSLGFNAYDSAGRSVFLTAGHCAAGYPTFSQNGSYIGGTRAYTFPGHDYAFVNIDNPSAWAPQPVVDEHNGYGLYVYGASQAAVGSSVCKSGRTTGWTCGTIQAYNVTVNYSEGTVYGLTQASACVEGGDSGGSWMSGNYAQGLTSGAQTYNGYCGQYVGYPNVSFYQPVTAALSAYGLRLQTP